MAAVTLATEAERPSSPPSLMAQLKAETQHLHRQIERVVPLMSASLDRAGYRIYLERLLGYLQPLEERLARFSAAFGEHGIDFEARRKSGWVRRDLLALGVDAPATAPSVPPLPELGSDEEAFGCLYVLEGSTLGGQIILRTLGPRLQLTAPHGLGFLTGYAEQTGSSWRAFAEAMTRFEARGCDRARVILGASQTFTTQMAWFESGRSDG